MVALLPYFQLLCKNAPEFIPGWICSQLIFNSKAGQQLTKHEY